MDIYRDATRPIDQRVEDLLSRMTLAEKVEQLGGDAPINERLGIPIMNHGEILHGVMWRSGTAEQAPADCRGALPTIFPQSIAMGCTFDPELTEQVGAAAAREARSLDRHHCYSPNLDVAWDPRFGRVEENFGEDPHLVARMGVAIIHGFQGRGDQRLDHRHVLATAKHFAGYGLVRGGLNGAEVDAGPRALREIHLPPFEAAVREAKVGSIMPSHHAQEGIPCHANVWLLRDVLRREWGFEGFVVSDNIDVFRLHSMQRVAADTREAALMALRAGMDQELVLGRKEQFFCYTHLPELVEAGRISEAEIDVSVRRVLHAKFLLGLMDDPDREDPREVCGCDAHRELALRAAERSHVLLANDGTLPLDANRPGSIALIGPHGDRCELGGYVGDLFAPTITPLAGLGEVVGEAAKITCKPGCTFAAEDEEADEDAMIAEAVQVAGEADVVILALGGSRQTCGEGRDNADIRLPGRQHELARAVLECGKPTVLLLIGGRPWAIADIADRCNAILLAWYGGIEAGRAIARTLTGANNPGGKLSMSFPAGIGHTQCSYLRRPPFNGSGFGEYRQHDNTPLYPFGHGLSYTTFSYSPIQLSAEAIGPAGTVTAAVTVTNTGDRAGDEVVQCYVTDEIAGATPFLKQLRGFGRIHLESGESRQVEFALGFEELSCWNARMERVVEPGWFTVQIGGTSAEGRTARFAVTDAGSLPAGDQPAATPEITRADDMEAPE